MYGLVLSRLELDFHGERATVITSAFSAGEFIDASPTRNERFDNLAR